MLRATVAAMSKTIRNRRGVVWTVAKLPDLSRLVDSGDPTGRVLSNYQPTVISEREWEAVSDFVVGNLTRVRGMGPDPLRQALRALCRHSVWCVKQGMKLDVELVLHPDTVDRFVVVHEGLLRESVLSRLRDDLRRLGPALTTRAPWPPREKTLKRASLSVPYTPREVTLIDRDVSGQRTEARTIAARAIRTLGLGCGIDGRANYKVRGVDVQSLAGGGVALTTSSGLHVVCAAVYEDDLLDLAERAGGGLLIGSTGSHKNVSNGFARRIRIDGGRIQLNATRLRSTWLLAHLDNGTNLSVLAAAAGVKSPGALQDLIRHMAAVPSEIATQMLRLV